MRSSCAVRQLPPLPPSSQWHKTYPLTNFNIVNRLSSYGGNKSGRRTNVVDPILADQLVESFNIGKDTHVLEAYPGLGVLTRALLKLPDSRVSRLTAIEPSSVFRRHGLFSDVSAGPLGREARLGEVWQHMKTQPQALDHKITLLPPFSDSPSLPNVLPESTDLLEDDVLSSNIEAADEDAEMADLLAGGESSIFPAMEHSTSSKNSSTLLDQLKKESIDLSGQSSVQYQEGLRLAQPVAAKLKSLGGLDRPPDMITVFPSSHDRRLSVVDDTIYDWTTLADLERMGSFKDVQSVPWDKDPPNLHFVAQIPESDLGEQLVSQWIGCMANRSWIFKYGRVKLSLIVRPALYDRLTALPGTKAYCKLSVTRAALCQYTSATTKYQDLCLEDVMSEKQLSRLRRVERDSSKPKLLSFSTKEQAGLPVKVRGTAFGQHKIADVMERYPDFSPMKSETASIDDRLADTTAQSLDSYYYPKVKRSKREAGRPGMLSLTLEPRKRGLIGRNNKDVWDYVLRRMFVMQGSPLEMAVKNLGLGANNLIPRLTKPSTTNTYRIDPKKLVREYDLQDWEKIVQVFQDWKFAPDVLLLGNVTHSEDNNTRMLGSGM